MFRKVEILGQNFISCVATAIAIYINSPTLTWYTPMTLTFVNLLRDIKFFYSFRKLLHNVHSYCSIAR